MKARIISLLVIIMSLCPAVARSAVEATNTFLVYGVSLSAAYGIQEAQGWVALLESRLNEEDWPY